MTLEDCRESSAPEKKQSGAIVITREEVDKRVIPLSPTAPSATGLAATKPADGGQLRPVALPAGFFVRLLAKAIDLIVAAIPFAFAGLLALLLNNLGAIAVPWASLEKNILHVIASVAAAYFAFYAVYSIFSHAAHGMTIGKCMCGIQVVPDGDVSDRSSFFLGRFMIAALGMLLLGVGHLLAAFRRDKRSLHDIVAGSRVVKRRNAV